MGLFNRHKNDCEQCGQKFDSDEALIEHAKEAHKARPVRCASCGKEFLHEKDRLHHVREENEKKVDYRRHKL